MLKKFKVSNFKCFQGEFDFDLSQTNGYEFNASSIKNGIVNNAIIYGYNGTGKSNLGLAIFDIIEHLSDTNRDEKRYNHYINAYSTVEYATFYYEFLIHDKTVKYEYRKKDYKTLLFEKLSIDDEEIVYFDRVNDNQFVVNLSGAETLNKALQDNQLSALKYIKNNTILSENVNNRVFIDFFKFIDGMLLYRSLEDRMYLGFDLGSRYIADDIIEKGLVADFEAFLNAANIECKLNVIEEVDNKKSLFYNFGDKNIPFNDISSTGTSSVTLFYFWFQRIKESKVSLLFIDEFDAFYHHELSALIIRKLKDSGVQFILTTHNVSILTNDLLRPDCYFLMNKKKIQSLSNCTAKELREAHNIEKMYKAGAFHVN